MLLRFKEWLAIVKVYDTNALLFEDRLQLEDLLRLTIFCVVHLLSALKDGRLVELINLVMSQLLVVLDTITVRIRLEVHVHIKKNIGILRAVFRYFHNPRIIATVPRVGVYV